MSDFIKFWWDCIRRGWESGDSLFAVLETVTAVITGALLWRTQTAQDKWRVQEEWVIKIAAAVFIASFLISTIFVAPYLKWKEEREAKLVLQKERPKFSENGSGFQVTPTQGQSGTPGLPGMAIKFLNTGKHPATNLTGRLIVTTYTLDADPLLASPLHGTRDFEPQMQMNFLFNINAIPTEIPPFFIFVGFSYDDSVSGSKYSQAFYMSWRGMVGGHGIAEFFDVTQEQKEAIKAYLLRRGEMTYEP